MTSKDRMQLAMKGEAHDRPALMCQFSLGFLAQHFSSDLVRFWYTPQGLAQAYISAATEYGFDGILVSISGRDTELINQIISVEDKENGAKLVTFLNGEKSFIPYNDFPYELSATAKNQKPDTIEELDIKSIPHIQPNDLPSFQFNILEEILRKNDAELSIHGEVGTCFEQFLNLFDTLENGLIALLDDDKKSQAAMQKLNDTIILLAREQCLRGIDALKLSSPFAGAGFISRDMYRSFVLPYEKELISKIHQEFSIPCYIHTCGAIGDRLDLMLETGADGLECLDPPPLGTVDLTDASILIGSKAFIKGNLDSVNELKNATPEQVLKIAEKRLAIGGNHRGGYILSTACSIAPDVPPENIAVLQRAVALYGEK